MKHDRLVARERADPLDQRGAGSAASTGGGSADRSRAAARSRTSSTPGSSRGGLGPGRAREQHHPLGAGGHRADRRAGSSTSPALSSRATSTVPAGHAAVPPATYADRARSAGRRHRRRRRRSPRRRVDRRRHQHADRARPPRRRSCPRRCRRHHAPRPAATPSSAAGGLHHARARACGSAQPSSVAVRADLPGVERAEQLVDPARARVDLVAGDQPAGDAGLVGDHAEPHAGRRAAGPAPPARRAPGGPAPGRRCTARPGSACRRGRRARRRGGRLHHHPSVCRPRTRQTIESQLLLSVRSTTLSTRCRTTRRFGVSPALRGGCSAGGHDFVRPRRLRPPGSGAVRVRGAAG